MPELIVVAGGTAMPFGVYLDDATSATALAILSGAHTRLTLKLSSPLSIPPALIADAPQGAKRLRTLAEIREGVAKHGARLESQWQALVDRLSSLDMALDLSAAGDITINDVTPLPVGAALVSAQFVFNANDCLSRQAELRASLQVRANCDVNLLGTVTRTLLSLDIDIHSATPLCRLRIAQCPFALPALALPDLAWAQLSGTTEKAYDAKLAALPCLPIGIAHDAVQFSTDITATHQLNLSLIVPNVRLSLFGASAQWGDVRVRQIAGVLSVEYPSTLPTLDCAPTTLALSGPLSAIVLQIEQCRLHLFLSQTGPTICGALTTRLALRSNVNPQDKVRLAATLPFEGSELVAGVQNGSDAFAQNISLIDANVSLGVFASPLASHLSLRLGIPNTRATAISPVLRTLTRLLTNVLEAVGEALSGFAMAVANGINTLAATITDALSGLDVTLMFARTTGTIEQVVLNIHRSAQDGSIDVDRMGMRLQVPSEVDIALLLDLRDGRRDAFVLASLPPGGNQPLMTMHSDLWLATSAVERAAGTMAPGHADPSHLFAAALLRKGGSTQRNSVMPLGIRSGRPIFLQSLTPALPEPSGAPSVGIGEFHLVDLDPILEVTFEFDKQAPGKLLPFLCAPREEEADSGGSALAALKQYVAIKDPGALIRQGDTAHADIVITVHALNSDIESRIGLDLELLTLTARLTSGAIAITACKPFFVLGMSGSFVDDSGVPVETGQFVLELGGDDPKLYLAPGVHLVLSFDKLSSATSKPLQFVVHKFVMHGAGVDLDGALAEHTRVPLNGLGTDFTFQSAQLCVRNGRLDALVLSAEGKLPPAVLGDIDVQLNLSFGTGPDGLALQGGELHLKKKGSPIRCQATHFVFTLDALHLRVFNDDIGNPHFCAFISGTARFQPDDRELARGLLGKLANVELSFTNCPVCGPSAIIERELGSLGLSFVVALDKPMRATLFECFEIEVRALGFEPNCKLFGAPTAAIVIGGQCRFASLGDVSRAECAFHKIYLAPALAGGSLRIRCEGLAVAIRLGSAFEIAGQVRAVSGALPSGAADAIQSDATFHANGFTGQGRVAIQGLPPMAASFGFVEVEHPVTKRVIRAWFVYIEAQHLSYHFQLGPIPFYLREVGLGLGFGFTYVAIKAIDAADSLGAILPILDHLAEQAIEPADPKTWTVDTAQGLTLVARVMISMSSASTPTETLVWKPDEEKDLPNVLLLNALIAMRNTTFIMTAQAWLGWNYSDWDIRRRIGGNELLGKQAMTGYVVLVGSRSEFLARLKSNKNAEVGPRLALPDAFKSALREVDFDATLYIRPGLFHMELGWPNRIRWTKTIGGANLTVAGGAIFRVHNESLLVGLNLEGELSFSMAGGLDAGAVGIAVSASVYAALTARMIGYLDARDVNQSLYYSLYSLQVRVDFAVSAWLEIDAWLCKITVRASFSLSLQIDVLAELAIRGDGTPGTRIRATIAVSIFGRALGLSVGLSSNTALVDAAAARVANFMQLGLIQPVPSVAPTLAQQDEALEHAREAGGQRRMAQAAAASVNTHLDALAPVPHEEALPEALVKPAAGAGDPIGPTHFQIIATYPSALPVDFPESDPSAWVYLTFMPRDAACPADASFYAAPLCTNAVVGPQPAAVDPHPTGSTLAPSGQVSGGVLGTPPVPSLDPLSDYYIDLSALPIQGDTDVHQWHAGTWHAVAAADMASIPADVDWLNTLGAEESTCDTSAGGPQPSAQAVRFEELFFAAFRTSASNLAELRANQQLFFEPLHRAVPTIHPREKRAVDAVNAHNTQLRRYARAIDMDPADRRCHEARDFLLHKFICDLQNYAVDAAAPSEAHALHLGLTFLVRRKTFTQYLETHGDIAPIAGIKKRVAMASGGRTQYTWLDSAPCTVFNPPSTMFANAALRFGNGQFHCSDGKIHLDWDLDWDGPSLFDIEYFIQYYEVCREVELDGEDIAPVHIRVKRADEDERGRADRVIRRKEWQFTDEFEDLTPRQRKALREAGGQALVRYTIWPVCVSNTMGPRYSEFVIPFGAMPELGAPRGATATIRIDPDATSEKRLWMTLEMYVPEVELAPRGTQHAWRLLLRPEQIIPSGQYGADAETQRSLRGWLGSSSTAQPGDVQILLRATKLPDSDGIGLALAEDLLNTSSSCHAMADTTTPRAWRILAQHVLVKSDPSLTGRAATSENAQTLTVVAHSASVEVELHVELAVRAGSENTQKVLALHPASFEFIRQADPNARPIEGELLKPVRAIDLAALEAGRAVLVQPDGARAAFVPHPDFFAATRLTWNVVPHQAGGADLAYYNLLAGFDIYRLDLDSALSANAAQPHDAWAQARRVTSARLMDPANIGLLPGEIGDPANWKAAYPSDAARRRAGGVWYSTAESYIAWPPAGVRNEMIPEPSDDMLGALVAKGMPDVIGLDVRRVQNPEDPDPPTWQWKLDLIAPDPSNDADQLAGKDWVLVDGKALHYAGNGTDAGASLRRVLRRLRATPYPLQPTTGGQVGGAGGAGASAGEFWRSGSQFDDPGQALPTAQLRGWRLHMDGRFSTARRGETVSLIAHDIALDFDRAVHPLLESIMTRMRRAGESTRLLDVDRRPPPVLAAHSAEAFMAGTGDAQDPYGWLALERLGLAVTLRMFDADNDVYLGIEALDAALCRAIDAIQRCGLHSEALPHLTVEYLLRPGALMTLTAFERCTEANAIGGEPRDAWLSKHALSMVRISVRPRIVRHYSYRVYPFATQAAKDRLNALVGPFEAMLAGQSRVVTIGEPADLQRMLATNSTGVLFIRYPRSAGELDRPSARLGSGNDRLNAFGRFAPVDWLRGDPAQHTLVQVRRFYSLLANVLDTHSASPADLQAISTAWVQYNQRFFVHASGSPEQDGVTIAFAATEATEPVMVAADIHGRASLTLPEVDGYAHQFAYAVKPQWRYAAMLTAAGYPAIVGASTADTLPFSAAPPHVTGTVKRTAPVLAPAMLSLGRANDTVWWRSAGQMVASDVSPADGAERIGTDAGLSSVLLLPHHPERRLARANAPAQRSLAHAGELFTHVGTPTDPAWCYAYLNTSADLQSLAVAQAPVDAAAIQAVQAITAQGPQNRQGTPLYSPITFDRARVRIASYLPHWYRSFAALAAASGTEVSALAITAIPEAGARLVLMDRMNGDASLIANHPWAGRTTIDAQGEQIVRIRQTGASAHFAGFGTTFGLLRYRDTTDPVTEQLWRDTVANLPDPAVCYQIDLTAPPQPQIGEPLGTVVPLARLVRAQPGSAANYRVLGMSREWSVTAKMVRGRRALHVMVSPLGKALTLPRIRPGDYPDMARSAAGGLRVPGGWTLSWLDVLLDPPSHIPDDPVSRLNWALEVWMQLEKDEIGVQDDRTGFFTDLPAVQRFQMHVSEPADDAEREQLAKTIKRWVTRHSGTPLALATLIAARLEALLSAPWPQPGYSVIFDVPWIPNAMIEPRALTFRQAISLERLGKPRYLLPELMRRTEYLQLAQRNRRRADQLWVAQKAQAMRVTQRLQITAQRGDAVPLPMLPIKLA